MHGTIFENIVIQIPDEVTVDQAIKIAKQSKEEYQILNKTLGGIDLELEGNDLVVRTWERSPVKSSRRLNNFLIPADVSPKYTETQLFEQSTKEIDAIDSSQENGSNMMKVEKEKENHVPSKNNQPFQRRKH